MCRARKESLARCAFPPPCWDPQDGMRPLPSQPLVVNFQLRMVQFCPGTCADALPSSITCQEHNRLSYHQHLHKNPLSCLFSSTSTQSTFPTFFHHLFSTTSTQPPSIFNPLFPRTLFAEKPQPVSFHDITELRGFMNIRITTLIIINIF